MYAQVFVFMIRKHAYAVPGQEAQIKVNTDVEWKQKEYVGSYGGFNITGWVFFFFFKSSWRLH